jgi:acetyl esterase/lipase
MAARRLGRRVSLRARAIRRITTRLTRPTGVSHEVRRANMLKIERAPRPRRVTYSERELGGVPALVAEPQGRPLERDIFFLHGGGYVMGSAGTHLAPFTRLAQRAAARITLLDYRLAPEHPYPAAVDDAVAAYRALVAEVDPATLTIAGDSAGGGLAIAALCRLRDEGDRLPACAYLVSPFTDCSASGESITTNAHLDPMITLELMREIVPMYLGDCPADHPGPSPVFADLAGLPPMLVQVGSHEVLLSDSTRLAERARLAGVEVELEIAPGMWHVYQASAPYIPEANAAFARAATFIRHHTSRAPATPVD